MGCTGLPNFIVFLLLPQTLPNRPMGEDGECGLSENNASYSLFLLTNRHQILCSAPVLKVKSEKHHWTRTVGHWCPCRTPTPTPTVAHLLSSVPTHLTFLHRELRAIRQSLSRTPPGLQAKAGGSLSEGLSPQASKGPRPQPPVCPGP